MKAVERLSKEECSYGVIVRRAGQMAQQVKELATEEDLF